eukprot:1448248-Rhodomonas_salina.3
MALRVVQTFEPGFVLRAPSAHTAQTGMLLLDRYPPDERFRRMCNAQRRARYEKIKRCQKQQSEVFSSNKSQSDLAHEVLIPRVPGYLGTRVPKYPSSGDRALAYPGGRIGRDLAYPCTGTNHRHRLPQRFRKIAPIKVFRYPGSAIPFLIARFGNVSMAILAM